MGKTTVKPVSHFEVKHKLEKLTYLEINSTLSIIVAGAQDAKELYAKLTFPSMKDF